ncbi:putative integral membrane protein [Desulfosarcina cetonica]|nr:putative integral membrane protein [Desulfosarcina cetonica]
MDANDRKTCKLTAVSDIQEHRGTDSQWIARKPGAWMLIAGAYLLGGGGMLAWLLFLIAGPHAFRVFDLIPAERVIVDTLLCLAFFIQHSIMVRRWFRLWLTRRVHADFHGALYATAAGTCLLALVLFWQPVGGPLWHPPDWIRWSMMTIFLSAGIGAGWGARSLGEFDALGVKPALQALDPNHAPPPSIFTVRGPYRWVRHPLYLFSLTIIWTGPVFTLDRLLHNGLWTVWIIIGAILEERDLTACFGDAYRNYRQRVPMLLPKSLKPCLPETRHAPEP